MKMFSDDLLAEIREQFDYVDSDPVDCERILLDSVSGSLRLKAVMDVLAELSDAPVDWSALRDPASYTGMSAELIERALNDER